MAERFQTQCPHCGVKFQITDRDLQAASGNVRCGSCLQVFQATENLVPLAGAAPAPSAASARPSAQQPAAPSARPTARPATPADAQATVQRPAISVPTPAAPAAAAPKAPAATKPAASHDDLVDQILRELEDSAQAAPKAPPAKPAAPAKPATPTAAPPKATPPSSNPSWAPPPSAKPKPAAPASVAAPAPTAGGGGWGAPPPKAPAKPTPAAPAAKPSKPVDESKFASDDPFGIQSTSFDEKDFTPEADESWAKDLLGEKPIDEREERVRKFQISADDLKLTDNTGVQHTSGLAARLAQMDGATSDGEMPTPIRRTAPAGGSQVDDEFDFLSDPGLTMQDVELPGIEEGNDSLLAAAQAHQVRWGRDIFWGTLSLVFLLVLLGQYLVANRDTLARDPAWQGVYAVACGAFGCQLPGASDIRRIQGANLVVRNNPAVPGVLVVDAIIYNRASFTQPFPRLELGFNDMQGNPVAGRVFEPAEYLKGELAETNSMPSDTPIHLTLEIRDPGATAVNYELRFLPPDTSTPGAS